MTEISRLSSDDLVDHVQAKLEAEPSSAKASRGDSEPTDTRPPAYALIVGAGFSYGAVPPVEELVHEKIGESYYLDQDQSSLELPESVLRRGSASFWEEFNTVCARAGLPGLAVDDEGLPVDPGAAYRLLFSYEGVNELFAAGPKPQETWLDRLRKQRFGKEPVEGERPREGEQFAKEALRDQLEPGAASGQIATEKSRLNPAHLYLAALLQAQQAPEGLAGRPFCRTIFTTNLESLLQQALLSVKLSYQHADWPEAGLDPADMADEDGAIHLVYVHGSLLRGNPANSTVEINQLANKNADVLSGYLETRDVITLGYSGWNDTLMAALGRCDSSRHRVYWCDVRPEPAAHVASFLGQRADHVAYVNLGRAGADGLMRSLCRRLAPERAELISRAEL